MTGVKFLLKLGVNVFYNRADSISAQKSFGSKKSFGKEKPACIRQAGFFIDVNGDEKFF